MIKKIIDNNDEVVCTDLPILETILIDISLIQHQQIRKEKTNFCVELQRTNLSNTAAPTRDTWILGNKTFTASLPVSVFFT